MTLTHHAQAIESTAIISVRLVCGYHQRRPTASLALCDQLVLPMELNVGDAIDLLGNQEMPVRQNGLLQALRAIAQLLLRLTGASALIVFAYYAHATISDMRESSYKK